MAHTNSMYNLQKSETVLNQNAVHSMTA